MRLIAYVLVLVLVTMALARWPSGAVRLVAATGTVAPYAATSTRAPRAVRVLAHRPTDPLPSGASRPANALPVAAPRIADALSAGETRFEGARTFGSARSIEPIDGSPAGPDLAEEAVPYRVEQAVPVGMARARGNAQRVGPDGSTAPVAPDGSDGSVAPDMTGPRGDASGWRWPLAMPARPIRGFDPPPQRWLAGHRGVDLAVRPGEKVMATGPGVVGLAERVAGRGVVTISHSEGLRTTYLPVRALVRPGDVVAAGQVIGIVEEDAVAHCTTVCLHWGLLRGRLYLDPLLLFGRGQVRLLPRWRVGEARRPS
ncbi:peptidoglycan DD-metalloendopeptidase family protein [Microbispora bryophytorum]|uniref:peptidoglycan DD-metalloendopeptidase family protein n=1 Tax=Microbispora bryophytorum TaxID=1460882 RepID=UPI00371BA3E6